MKLLTLVLVTGAIASSAFAAQSVEDRLRELGIVLPAPATPAANYVNAVRTGNHVYLAGHGPRIAGGKFFILGKVGRDVTPEQASEAARVTAINLLATLKGEIGDLNKVKKIVKVLGMVNAVDSFADHPRVINGASDLLVSIFGEAIGKHARSAVGVASLPFNIPVEIEMIVEISEDPKRP